MTKITKKRFLEALKGTYGVRTRIAEKLGVTRGAITTYIKKHPELEPIIEEETQEIIDTAENKLFSLINQGEFRAIDKILSTKGKNRGYAEKQEIEHNIPLLNINLIEKSVEEIKDGKSNNQPETERST